MLTCLVTMRRLLPLRAFDVSWHAQLHVLVIQLLLHLGHSTMVQLCGPLYKELYLLNGLIPRYTLSNAILF